MEIATACRKSRHRRGNRDNVQETSTPYRKSRQYNGNGWALWATIQMTWIWIVVLYCSYVLDWLCYILCMFVWWSGVVVARWSRSTKLIYVGHGQYWDGWPCASASIRRRYQTSFFARFNFISLLPVTTWLWLLRITHFIARNWVCLK